MSVITFLIADDFPSSRAQLRNVIESTARWRVVGEADDGSEAIAKARQLRPHIVILDVSMPGINGIRAAKAIKESLPETHIIIYSAHNAPLIAQRALAAGADAYFDKSELEQKTLSKLVAQWRPS
ncbi:MAG TPA: response regulator transcription factor, partial [Anaerolineae bacterium]|nr:response regulator transcription factor [Anaerolineae bacterium]